MNVSLLYYALKVSAVGGIVAADETSYGQFMLSRPIAAGFLTGIATGNLMLGTILGAVFELLYIDVLPFGGSRFPTAGFAAVISVSICGYLGLSNILEAGGIIPLLFLYSALTANIGGRLVVGVRRTNSRLLKTASGLVESGDYSKAGLIHCTGILVSFLRGFVTILVAFSLTVPFKELLETRVLGSGPGSMYLLMPFVALGLGIACKMYVTRRRIVHMFLGGFITILILYI
ncbi:MAG: PTS sugar transporter subunit IIC [Candidatus Glassbacteria bacterium]